MLHCRHGSTEPESVTEPSLARRQQVRLLNKDRLCFKAQLQYFIVGRETVLAPCSVLQDLMVSRSFSVQNRTIMPPKQLSHADMTEQDDDETFVKHQEAS